MANILVVEDNSMNREFVVDLLEVEGHKVSQAENGFQALEFANKNEFDLILMDIQMPKMDGLEVLQRLKSSEKTRDIPAIAITAHEMKGMMVLPSWKWRGDEKFVSVGCDGYISKPIDIIEFKKTIEEFL
ncbi:chemotaxis protein CheY [Methanococcoides methylutens]|uniref:Chemotaxis protein CheY n=1 Tax=Methanococcoides methylutens TaxID=2226 RepID=A0A099T5G1_METMT|nr:response regulator [Methanococcoides methylutens]KGK99398.1 chemotaxis protein CheY [Methanococcoides methylutens]